MWGYFWPNSKREQNTKETQPVNSSVQYSSLTNHDSIPLSYNNLARLKNLGYSCFLNSLLQCLNSSHHTRKFVCGSNGAFHQYFGKILNDMQMNSPSQVSNKILKDTYLAIMTKMKWDLYSMQDATELLDEVLSMETCNTPFQIESERLTCPRCKSNVPSKILYHKDPFLRLPIDFSGSIHMMMKAFECSKCPNEKCLLDINSKLNTPPVLLLKIERSLEFYKKDCRPVSTPETVCFQGETYRIKSVVAHFGSTSNTGHFSCFLSCKEGWAESSDQNKRLVSWKEVKEMTSRTSSMLMFEKEPSKSLKRKIDENFEEAAEPKPVKVPCNTKSYSAREPVEEDIDHSMELKKLTELLENLELVTTIDTLALEAYTIQKENLQRNLANYSNSSLKAQKLIYQFANAKPDQMPKLIRIAKEDFSFASDLAKKVSLWGQVTKCRIEGLPEATESNKFIIELNINKNEADLHSTSLMLALQNYLEHQDKKIEDTKSKATIAQIVATKSAQPTPSVQQAPKQVILPKPLPQKYPSTVQCFFDLQRKNKDIGRVVMDIYFSKAPIMARNFIELCTGVHGFGYKFTDLWNVPDSDHVVGGHLREGDKLSIYNRKPFFGDSSPLHDEVGMLRMRGHGTADDGRAIVSSQFMIWMKPKNFKNYTRTLVFGKVVKGMDVLGLVPVMINKKDNKDPTKRVPPCKIISCGIMS